ncbi:MAG: hypothetical protein RBU30_14990, partial [Polyangia bacterium]|nr:hypothetical protein [Polyangia bacterium]
MASGTGKKVLIGVLGVLIAAGGGLGIYVWYYGSKHKVEYGKKGEITGDTEKSIKQVEGMLKQCSKEVFLHVDLPYKPKPGDRGGDFSKAVEAIVKGIRTCLIGELSADGMGYSGQMDPKHLAKLLEPKECKAFADTLVKFPFCQYLFGDLEGHAGFQEDTGEEDGKEDGMKSDDMAADDMAADGMKSDDMAADDMAADGMKSDDMAADDMAADGMKSDDMAADD